MLWAAYFLIKKDIKNASLINEQLLYNSTLLSNISDAIITTDANYNISGWNKYAEALYGYTEEEVRGRKLDDFISLSDNEKEVFLSIIQKRKTWKGEMLHHHKDGSPINVLVSTSAIKNEKNELIGAIGVLHNITDKTKLQEELKLLSENLQQQVKQKASELNSFFERIPDAFFALDNKWRYVFLNQTAEKLHGKDTGYLLGKNIWETHPHLVGNAFYNALHEAKDTQQEQRSEFYYEKEDKWFEDLIYPSPEGISVYYYNITKKKKAELALKTAHARLNFHLNNTPLGIIEFDSNLTILQWSKKAEEIFGWTAEDVENNKVNIEQLIKKEDRASFYKKLQSLAGDNNTGNIIANRGVSKSGKEIYCEWYNSFLKDENNKTGVVLSMVKDVTTSEVTKMALANAELKFRSLVEESIVGVYIRKENKIIYVNPRFAEISGYTKEELYTNEEPLNQIFSEEKEKIIKLRKDYADKKTGSLHYEFRGLKKDGSFFHGEVFGTAANLNGEEVIIGTLIDITDRKETSEKVRLSEEALKISNERFELVAKATNDAIWDWDIESDTLSGNEIFCKFFGAPPNTTFKFNTFLEKVHEDDREKLINNYGKALQNKNSLLAEEFRFKINDDNYKFINDRAYLLYDKSNRAYRMLGAMQDITEMKKAEESLITSEKKYRILFQDNPMPMWILSLPDRKFIDVNAATFINYGYTREEFLQMNLSHLHPEKNWIFEDKDINNTIGNKRYEGINDHRKKDGTIIKVNIITHNIIYEGKSAILALANDVTAKFVAEEKLQKSAEAYRELASNLETIRESERTHMAREIHDELGQQLTGLKMDISWINKRVQSEDKAVQEKMRDTIQLIDKTVITVRRIATELRPSILDDLGLVAAMEWQSDEFEKRSEIKSIFTTNISHITVSNEIATGIFRIFQESLTNVSRHSKGTEVLSSFKKEGNIITLTIVDNGVGFNEAEIAQKRTLGLLGMKERVGLINGTYQIKGNNGNGMGASVIITVPLS
jgi:PAS domain S-box-containing protein